MGEPVVDWTRHRLPTEAAFPDRAAIGLLRLLFAVGPIDVEAQWAHDAAVDLLRASVGGGPCWLQEIGADGDNRYIFIGRGKSQYRKEPPSEEELAGVPLLVVPRTTPSPIVRYLDEQISRLPHTDPIRIHRDALLLRLAECRDMNALAPLVAFRDEYIAAAGGGGQIGDPSIGNLTDAQSPGLTGPARAALTDMIAATSPARAPRDVALDMCGTTTQAYVAFRLPGPIAARMLLLAAFLSRVQTPSFALLGALAGAAPDSILGDALTVLYHEPGGPGIAIEVAEGLADEGDKHVGLAHAAGANDRTAFMGEIFVSCVFYEAAFFCCKFLLMHPGLSAKDAALAQSRTAICDEETVLSRNALLIHACNDIDGRYAFDHRAAIQRIRETAGEAAARAQWTDYRERQRFYPLLDEAFLMGQREPSDDGAGQR